MRRGVFLGLLWLWSGCILGQDTLRLTRRQCEQLFLQNNLLLLAQQLEVPKSEAEYWQARLWPNPTLSLDEVNLWAGARQLEVFHQTLPAFGPGTFGKNRQISLALEQLIITASKRRKLMAAEKIRIEKSQSQFAELLRALRTELRRLILSLQYGQQWEKLLQTQLERVRRLTAGFRRQVEAGNFPRAEWMRLKAIELSLQNQISQTQLENTVVQKELKILIQVPENIFLYVQDTLSSPTYYSLDAGLLSALTDTALSLRPDARQAALEYAYYDKRLAYEKSLKTPDITLKGGYDRGGNFMFNFIGFGLALDIPVFHRNQGHIAWARLARDQAGLLLQQKRTEVRQEVATAFFNLGQAVKFFATMDPQYDAQLDAMMDSYERNYQNRLISLLEFNDFMTAYMDNKKALLDAVRRVQECTEELYFSVGKDVVLNP
ncbi:MAG: TolC family protein [Flavobacteriales bacterium]|nr:TolC family protein [Flavobacteriales bacterium]MCX7649868.1 TolC family protein [Flavobacteriales bacterium]MDW8432916.1 TolC family protein [Flavobacteriales bacterium]